MDESLIIIDDYVESVGTKCRTRGKNLEDIVERYIAILDEISTTAIMNGEISEATEAFSQCAKLISSELTSISEEVKSVCDGFIVAINEADEYIF